ncbi:MAG: phage minor head protein [Ruminococcus callidus]|uniref:phage head morphogenesis protein n=1 Tax=Ruminococcus callidus TaxID=40519 RepID=UPI002E78602E|nr:phage minor head protein [Ruminococcus callidus]MEE0505850.1 phage minor head protein [Ruminococcus callidus]
MTPAQKQTTQYELLSEKKVMEQLERSYQKALEDVKDRLRQLDERTDVENRQAVAYQKAFQQGLQKQLERILGKLHSKTYRTVQEYLQDCYLTGHTAVLYELQSDGLRLSLPVPQDKVCQAAVNDTKLVKPLYDSIGEDFAGLKKHITDIVSAGFASGASYGDMANQITGKMIGNYATLRGGALGRAKLIVRTEGNRIANAARLEAARTAKQQGADLVKQWDSTMDRKTRPHHVQLDGQVRELDEPFEVDGRKAQAPGKFGIASEDINCRCHAYSRPRWAVRADSDYKYDNQHRALVKVSSESYAEYRAGYIREETEKRDVTIPHHDGHTAEVTPPTPKDNGGTGKTYSPEKISGKSLTSGADSGIIKDIESSIKVQTKYFNQNLKYYSIIPERIENVPKIKISGLTEQENDFLRESCKALLKYMQSSELGTEGVIVLNSEFKEIDRYKGTSGSPSIPLKQYEQPHIVIHNHPDGLPFSEADIQQFIRQEKMMCLGAIGNDGTPYFIYKTPDYDVDFFEDYVNSIRMNHLMEMTAEDHIRFSEEVLDNAIENGVTVFNGKNKTTD